ncbi:MAG: hypothetical protein F6K11_05245 [Leptolyngbya sp. SIO3F4]|nr:hypothetical protein [Leptolyngbya sp. SIO3F4]
MRALVRNGVIGFAVLTSVTIHGLTLLGSSLIWAVMYLSIAQVEYDRFSDPTGNYEVVLTYTKLYHVMPMMLGQGSDMSGKIAIYDRDGNFYGGDSLDFVRHGHGVEWTEHGASLQFVGEWDFEAGTYSHWSDDGKKFIVEQIRK